MISYNAENSKVPNFPKRKISGWIKEIATENNRKVGEIGYIFCPDEKILEINRQYLKHNYYTDIITFDYSRNNTISGDIFVSIDTVRSNAKKFGTDFEDELYRVIIHGVLHLCGFKDKSASDVKMMRNREDMALEELNKILKK